MIAIIGYGNPLRSDDAVGQRMAQIMEQRLTDEQIQVHPVYQLTPELVESICCAELVVFMDARVGDIPGRLVQEIIEPQGSAGAFTHNVNPGTLLAAAQELYGMKPKGILISIVGADFDFGSELSPQLNTLLASLADQVEAIIKTNIDLQHEEETHHA